MTTIRRTTTALAFALLAAVLVALPARADDAADQADTLGRWHSPDVTVYVDPGGADARRRMAGSGWKVNAAIRQWNAAGVVAFRRVTNPAAAEVIVRVVDDLPAGTYGLTYTTYDPTRPAEARAIVHSDVELSLGTPAAFRSATAAHELGHALGLGHTYHQDSVMVPGVMPGRAPSAWDLGWAMTLYRGQ